GIWRGVLQLNDSTELPFNFEIIKTAQSFRMEIINVNERIIADELTFKADSLFIKMPIFDSEFRLKIMDTALTGNWINYARQNDNTIAFKAIYNEPKRFITTNNSTLKTKERWKVIFEPNTKNEYSSVGEFNFNNGKATGTFTTETGDYRYLEGVLDKGKFMVSCFDGAHAFLFTAYKRIDSLINGQFYSGKHSYEKWVAVQNDTFELRDPEKLTYLKDSKSTLNFSFKNLEGTTVSLTDKRFKNKVVIVQLMGSWCPNCMDETKFLAKFYDQYQPKGLEIVGLAFERTSDFNKSVANVTRLKNRFNAHYEFLITGKTDANQASEALPILNKVMAFPTTIIIDKKGRVRKIYTGFYGPATGNKYDQYVEQTTLFIEKLLKE
ncbi:MAG: TlpA disulfide reductase family protein, partial [Bacteroidia bacterium]